MVELDIDKICRVCLQVDVESSFLFDEQNAVKGVSLSDMIAECTIYTVRRFDGFPDLICKDCMEQVRTAYAFKKQYESSHRKLINFLESKCRLPEQPSAVNDKCIQTDDTSMYPCEKCADKFINYERLRDHRLVAHKGTANLCRLCSKKFRRITDLKNHIAVCHPESGLSTPNECGICRKKFVRKEHVLRHLQKVHKIPVGYKVSKVLNEKFQFEPRKSNPDGCDSHEETENDVGSDSPDPIDPVDESETEKNEASEQMEIVDDPNPDLISEIESNDGDVRFCDGLNEPHLFCSDDDEIPLSTLVSKNVSPQKASTAVKEEPDEATTLPESPTKSRSASPVEKQEPAPERETKSPPKRRFKCSQCDKKFTRSNHVKRHLLSHSQEKPFSCDICDKGFTRADHLKLHMSNHSTEKAYECHSCDRSFNRIDRLNRHLRQHRSGAKLPRSEKCNVCYRSFSSKYYLQKHMRLHTEKDWKCKFCELECDSRESLKEHTKLHSSDRPFLCSECGQSFHRKDYLLIHMRRHNGEKPYKCKYCEKGFPRATDLKVHERYHTGEKTHLCTICGKGFHRSYNLVVHMRVHTGERPYQCPHCPKNFAQGNDLKVHVRRHTGERFTCETCGDEFMQAYNLTQHNQIVHGIEDKTRKGRVIKVKSENFGQELISDAEGIVKKETIEEEKLEQ